MSDIFFMKQAYELAFNAQSFGEVPVGAILVDKNQQIIGRGFNQVIKNHDPSAHAELVAIREACLQIGNYRLPGTTLYVTLEPCCMCAGALVHARIERLVFATQDPKTGAAGSVYNLLQGTPLNHQVIVEEGVLREECASLLSAFFKARRLESR